MSRVLGLQCRNLAIYSVTLAEGRCPPSPGFAPWATFISISAAEAKNVGVTPNLPDATCFMALFLMLQYRDGSSPPSPLLLLIPSLLHASAIASCASGDSAPTDIAPDTNFLSMRSSVSTFSMAIGLPLL